MDAAGFLGRITIGISGGREREGALLPQQQGETVFYDNPHELLPRRVDCGLGFGEVLLNPDGSVIVNSMQLARYVGYEEENHLKPADVKPLPNGRFLISVRK